MTSTDDDDPEDRRLLDAVYQGDKVLEEADNKRGIAFTLGWSDFAAYAAIYPQHEQCAKDAIDRMLGYLPHPNITIPHEVFIRTLMEQHVTGAISDEEYTSGLVTHVTHIRNDDMTKLGWVKRRNPTTEEYREYSNTLTDFKNRVSYKVEKFFGEVPELVYSLQAEMMLRNLMRDNLWLDIPELTPFDFRAFTIIAFRKAYLTNGSHAANHTPLVGRRN